MPRNAALFSLGESVGIEYETDNVLSQDAQSELESSVFGVVHDASIESDVFYDQRVKLLVKNTLPSSKRDGFGSRVTLGTEIISHPIDTETGSPDMMVRRLTKWLSEYGEPPTSLRAGIHIHVGLGSTNLSMLKSCLSWGRRLEALFFHLAGNGYMFRGVSNDAAYCRPITREGPPYLASRNEFVKTFDIDQMMTAKSSKEFWYMYGGTNQTNIGRYVPHRYIWLNLYSLLAHGTLEFRPWNKTLNANFILAEIELCKLFTSAVIKSLPTDGIEHSVFDSARLGIEGLHEDLDMLAEQWDIRPDTYKVLSGIINNTPICVLPEDPTLSHITNYTPQWDGSFEFVPIKSKTARRPEIVTIHSLRGEPERN